MDRTIVLGGERDTENLYSSGAVAGTLQDTKKPMTQINNHLMVINSWWSKKFNVFLPNICPFSSLQGDSGGPLVCKGAFHALVSGGPKCGDAKKPGIYILLTRKFQAWIKSNLAPSHAD